MFDSNVPVALVPRDDLIGHVTDGECPCGPTGEPWAERPDGSWGYVIRHHWLRSTPSN